MKILSIALLISGLSAVNTAYSACNIVGGKAYGDCAGVRINDRIKGRITVRSYISESGIIEGATILRDGELHLNGISNGDITVREGGRFILSGVVNGTVKNLGGNVEIEGLLDHLHTIGGQVIVGGNVDRISGSGPITYKRGSVVGGVPLEKTLSNAGKR